MTLLARVTLCVTMVAVLTLLPNAAAFANTYYIDFQGGSDSNNGTSKTMPWKYCPGMKEFSGSYTHTEGDIFIFKGGVTWPYSSAPYLLNIAYSGGIDKPDYYTNDKTWYVGSSWTNPIFEGNNRGGSGGYMIQAFSKNHFVIDGLQIQNYWSVDSGGTGIATMNCSDMEIRNCIFDTHSVNAWAYGGGTVGNMSKIYFHDNVIKHAGRINIAFGSASSPTSYVIDDMQIYNNDFQGQGDGSALGCCNDASCISTCSTLYSCCRYHGDGIMIGANGSPSCGREPDCYAITNLKIYSNTFHGTWLNTTAFIYINSDVPNLSTKGALVYNNVFGLENSDCRSTVANFIAVTTNNIETKIYNNTLSGDMCVSTNPSNGIAFYSGSGQPSIINNILTGFSNGILVQGGVVGTVTIDSNLFYNFVGYKRLIWDARTGGNVYYTCSGAKAAGFQTTYCSTEDPRYKSLPTGGIVGSWDWTVSPGSPAIANGQPLPSVSPQTTWNIGALIPFAPLGKLSPPTGLRAN